MNGGSVMLDPVSRSFSRDQMPSLLALVGEKAKRRWPLATYMLSSDVAWPVNQRIRQERMRD